MSRLTHIFLDLDGPLLDGRERHYACYRRIVESLGGTPIDIDTYWNSKRARGNRRDLLKASKAEQHYDRFLDAWLEQIESPEALTLDHVQPGALDAMRRWKEQGIVLTLVTLRKDANALEDQLKAKDLRQWLDAVLVCDHAESGAGKADAVRRRYPGADFSECAYWIGDTEADWEAARIIGCPIMLVANGLRDPDFLNSLDGAKVVAGIAAIDAENGA